MTTPVLRSNRPAPLGVPQAASPRVVVVCAGCGLEGSVARVALGQAGQLASAFEVCLLSETFPAHLLPGIRTVAVAPRRFDYLRRLCHVPNAFAFASAVESALDELERESSIGLVICHDLAIAGIIAPALKRRLATRFVVCAHEDIALRPPGTYGILHTQLHHRATPYAYREADAVLAISPHMAERAEARGVAPERITLAPPGLEPLELGLSQEGPVEPPAASRTRPLQVLYAGRLAIEKGVDVLLAACRLLGQRGTPYALELIGGGGLRAGLERRARQLGVSDHARFLGPVPRERLGSYYTRADLVCMPSLDEPFGAVALEALMSGTPVVASDVGGLPYVVRHGENGLLVPPNDPESLAGALGLLDRDRARLASLRHAAQASVRRRFSWEHVGRPLLDGVRKALAAPRTGSGSSAARGPAPADGA